MRYDKIERFKYYLPHKIIYRTIKKLVHCYRLIKQAEDFEGEKPLIVFRSWLLDVVQYGAVAEFIRATIFGWGGLVTEILYAISFGIARWLFLDLVKELKRKE